MQEQKEWSSPEQDHRLAVPAAETYRTETNAEGSHKLLALGLCVEKNVTLLQCSILTMGKPPLDARLLLTSLDMCRSYYSSSRRQKRGN